MTNLIKAQKILNGCKRDWRLSKEFIRNVKKVPFLLLCRTCKARASQHLQDCKDELEFLQSQYDYFQNKQDEALRDILKRNGDFDSGYHEGKKDASFNSKKLISDRIQDLQETINLYAKEGVK